jgi:hypothetical protein
MDRPDRPTAGSLLEVSLARLREVAAGRSAASYFDLKKPRGDP